MTAPLPTVDDVLAGRAWWTMLLGDAIGALASLPDASFDAVITDAPYSSGGQFRSDRALPPSEKYVGSRGKERVDFSGDSRDQRGFVFWCTLWLREALRVTKPGGAICCFTDWRQLPATTDAVQAGGWVWRGIVPWDKTEGCRPHKGRFSAQCEYVVWGTKGPRDDADFNVGVIPGIVRAFPNPRDKYHIAGKPTPVMMHMARIAPVGGTILDLFSGSGSTGAGALRMGRRFVGVDHDPHWFAESCKRLTAEQAEISLGAAEAGQRALFDKPNP